VLPPLLRVREDLVGVLYLLEALLGAAVVGVGVGVVLPGQLPVGLADLVPEAPLGTPSSP